MREVIANDRALSASEMRRLRIRQRGRVYRLGYVIVRSSHARRRVVAVHHINEEHPSRPEPGARGE